MKDNHLQMQYKLPHARSFGRSAFLTSNHHVLNNFLENVLCKFQIPSSDCLGLGVFQPQRRKTIKDSVHY